jgi:hypothetical protein
LIPQYCTVSGALYGYFWQIRKDWVRLPSAMRDYSLTVCAFLRSRGPAPAREITSGDRDELLPLTQKYRAGKPCRSGEIAGGGRCPEVQGSVVCLLRNSFRLFPGFA